MSQSNVRIAGSGYTTFTWRGKRIAYMQVLQDTAPTPVAAAVPIQSMDEKWPSEIVTAGAVGPGTLRLTNFELWNAPFWTVLAGLEKTATLLDIFTEQVKLGAISCRKVIKSPPPATTFRTKVYHNCVITDASDSETVQINTMTMPKNITIMYTHYTTI